MGCCGFALFSLTLVSMIVPAACAMELVTLERPDEGTTLFLVEDHRAALVSLILDFPAGSWSSWSDDHGGREAWRIQLFDKESRLRARADELSAELWLSAGARSSQLSLSCLKQDLPQALTLVRDLLEGRNFDRHQLRRWTREERLWWQAGQKRPATLRAAAAARRLYKAGDPRRRRWERPRKLERRVARLLQARDTIVRLRGRIIGFAGDLSPQEARELAKGLLPPAAETLPDGLAIDLPGSQVDSGPALDTEITLPGLNQVYLALTRESLCYEDEDWPAFLVADHVLAGHFYSRLYRALRHEGGDTYTAASSGRGSVETAPYSLETFTRVENAEVIEEKLRETLAVFSRKGITEAERRAAISHLEGARAFSRQSPGQILRRRIVEVRSGLEAGALDAQVEQAAALSLGEINAFIRAFYDRAHFMMIRVIPLAPSPAGR